MRKKPESAFSKFDNIPYAGRNPTAQTIFEYERHYMDLLRKYKDEITYINGLLESLRTEQKKFWETDFPRISQKLDDEQVDKEVKAMWLRHVEENMSRSFQLSEKLVEHYMIKNIEQFQEALREAMHD